MAPNIISFARCISHGAITKLTRNKTHRKVLDGVPDCIPHPNKIESHERATSLSSQGGSHHATKHGCVEPAKDLITTPQACQSHQNHDPPQSKRRLVQPCEGSIWPQRRPKSKRVPLKLLGRSRVCLPMATDAPTILKLTTGVASATLTKTELRKDAAN